MDTKLKSTISKIRQERTRGNHARAVKRATDALRKFPDSPELYREVIDASLETAESLRAIQFIKKAFARLPDERPALMNLARERAGALGDAVVGKFLLEETIRRREFREARAIAGEFADRTARDLLQRTRMKRSTLASAAHGGHAVDGETMTNIISEAILSARLGRSDAAATAAAQALDADPDQAEALTEWLEDLAEENPGCARAGFVLARCLGAVSRHAESAARLTAAVKLDRELGPDALDLLRDAGDDFDEIPVAFERAMLEILLITDQFDRAAEVARPWLDRDEDDVRAVVRAVAAYTRDGGAINDLHMLMLDAATQADSMDHVEKTLTALATRPENRTALLEWLDSSNDRVFPADVELVRAQLLIDDQRHQDAARALKALCVASHADIPRVSKLLAVHRDDDQALADLADEIDAPREPAQEVDVDATIEITPDTPEKQPASTGENFEVFESQEFRLSADGDDAPPEFDVQDGPALVDVGDGPQADDFNVYDGSNILGSPEAGARPKAPKQTVYAEGRRPLDTDTAGIMWDEESDDDQTSDTDSNAIDEGYVRNIADGLYSSGAATFFHIENEAEAAPEPGSQPEPEPDPEETTLSYDERFSLFLDGRLDEADAVDLMEEAAHDGRTEELGQLVELVPSDESLALRRGLCGAEYELMEGRPARALEYLKEIRRTDMSEEQRKATWFKTVACQRNMQDFDAAHQTMLQLVTLYPDCPEVAEMAARTYREYLQNQCTEAPVLEKVTSLDGDA